MKRIPSIATLSFLSLAGCATSTEQTRGVPAEAVRWCVPDLGRAVTETFVFATTPGNPNQCLVVRHQYGVVAGLYGVPCSELGLRLAMPNSLEGAVFVLEPLLPLEATVEGSYDYVDPHDPSVASGAGLDVDLVISFEDGQVYRLAGCDVATLRGCVSTPSNP
jgi:hypothetical protein